MTQKYLVSAREVVELLNEAMALDPGAVRALINNRVACNKELADHPTIQCVSHGHGPKRNPAVPEGADHGVGLLGLLNGIFGLNENGRGPVEAVYDVDPETGALLLGSFFCNIPLPIEEVLEEGEGDEGPNDAA